MKALRNIEQALTHGFFLRHHDARRRPGPRLRGRAAVFHACFFLRGEKGGHSAVGALRLTRLCIGIADYANLFLVRVTEWLTDPPASHMMSLVVSSP